MIIKITGTCANLSHKELRFAIRFFAKKLMSDKLADALLIEFNFIQPKVKSYNGSVTWLDSNSRPREFDIEMNSKMGKRRILIALAHEMVHVKQMAKGELKDYVSPKKGDLIKWMNKDLNQNMEYFERPWEIEAYGRELGLYEMYKYELKTKKIKF